jgi:hypothetical protein
MKVLALFFEGGAFMAFFEDDQRHALRIERMVFHLVGPREEEFVRLEAMDPGRFSGFFIDRILSVSSGAEYRFSDASATRERLHRIAENEHVFQDESEQLARDFQRMHGGSAAAGAFLIFVLTAEEERFFALLKYDDETVLTYDVEEGEAGRKRATLDALERTFVQNRNALQKSALIRLDDAGGTLTVVDRQNPQKVARYFENFLDATRVHSDAELTKRLVEVTREVIKQNRDHVSADVYRDMARRTFDAASGRGDIDGDNQKAFLETVIGGALPDDHPLVEKFTSALRRARIDGAPVRLDPTAVSRPSARRYETVNGIKIRAPIDFQGAVVVEENRIIINDALDKEYDESERSR